MKPKKIIFSFIILLIISIFTIWSVSIYIDSFAINNVYSIETVPEKQAALVLGAKVYNNGKMSDIFADRVKTAVNLYQAGKVEKILVSGDHGRVDYDEVNAAKEYLLEQGIPQEDIFLDHAGFDTYDSLYRARDVFDAESLIIVTQNFHLPRALYIAKKLNLEAVGVSADLNIYVGEQARNRREVLAKIKAWFNIIFHSSPKYLGDKIPLSGDGTLSWD